MSAYRLFGGAVAALLAVASAASADDYTKWTKNEAKGVYHCEYTYKPKDTTVKVEYKQNVIVYYDDKDRAGWAYYYNMDNKPWARCAIPGNPKYDAKNMYWEALKPDAKGYEPFKDKQGDPYPAGYCPAPKDGKSPIPTLPIPPK